MRQRSFAILLFLLIGAAVCLTGCGGGSSNGGGGNRTATVQFNIVWPAAGRATPNAQSVTVSLTSSSGSLGQQTAARPAGGQTSSTLTFSSVPAGQLLITAAAFPNADGSGAALGTATATKTVLAGQTVQTTLDLTTEIAHVTVTPTAVAVTVGNGAALVATATDTAGNLVLIAPGNLHWSSSAPAVVTVNSSGVITGVATGSTTINASEAASGLTATATVNVTTATFLVPAAVTLTIGDTQTFAASFAGNPAVTWSVAEGAAGGTITTNGIYTAPNVPGTYHVVATSNVDPTQTASATVTVEAGTGTIIVK